VYDRWAESLMGKKDSQGAVDVYAKALALYPKDNHLTTNAVATWDAWAATFMDNKDWAGAIKVYQQALQRFPDDGVLKNNIEYCKAQLKAK
jgi:tetratricopeptide (TPR) repeat protein